MKRASVIIAVIALCLLSVVYHVQRPDALGIVSPFIDLRPLAPDAYRSTLNATVDEIIHDYVEDALRRRLLYYGSDGQCAEHKTTAIFLMISSDMITDGLYSMPLETVHCYADRHGYQLHVVDDRNDSVAEEYGCMKFGQLLFRKHCAVAAYLRRYAAAIDWMLVLDADTGVVDPNRCIADYTRGVNDSDMIFYERFFNFEIASGNYLVRNTPRSIRFLDEWAAYEPKAIGKWSSLDNGALQVHFLKVRFTLLIRACSKFRTLIRTIQ